MPASLDPVDTDNLRVGKGIVSFQESGNDEARDLGEVSEAEISLTIEKLDYFSSRSGIRSKVKSVVLERGGTFRMVMNSIVPLNLAIFFLGSVEEDGQGRPTFDILDSDAISGQIYYHGTNAVGPRYDVHLHNVEFTPTGSMNLIDEDDWTGVEVTGEILQSTVTNKFGTVTLTNLDSDT